MFWGSAGDGQGIHALYTGGQQGSGGTVKGAASGDYIVYQNGMWHIQAARTII